MTTDLLNPPVSSVPARTHSPAARRALVSVALGAAAFLAVAGVAALILARYQNPDVHYDELFHVLAAEHLLSIGKPKLVPGGDNYRRGELYTQMVALAYQWCGQSVASARLPALGAAAMTIAAVGLFGLRAGGWLAATAAAGGLLLTPGFINSAATARFYSAHTLSVVLLALLVFEACRPGLRPKWRIAAWIGAAACAYLALHLHMTTVVAGMGLAAWVGLCAVIATTRGADARQRRIVWGAVAAAVVLLPVAAAVLLQTAWGRHAWETFRWTPGWSSATTDDARFYHKHMLSLFDALWALFPLAAVVALATRWRPASLCLAVFGVGFVVQSLGGAKAERYILYTYPFFWLTWGLAADPLLRGIHALVVHALTQALPRPGFRLPARAISVLTLAACLGVFLHLTPFTAIARRMLTTPDRNNPYLGTRWAPAVSQLRELAAESDAVVTTADLKALHYLGRLDAAINKMSVPDGSPEFTLSPNTLCPLVSTPESMIRVMTEAPSGLIIVEPPYWRRDWGVPTETADLIEARTARVEAAPGSDLMIFRWPKP